MRSIRKLVTSVVGALAAGLLVKSLPDVARYLKLREMQPRVTRYNIVPERSRAWIEGRSSLHAIRSSADGLVGFIDLEVGEGGAVTLATPPSGAISLPLGRLSSGNALEDRELHKRVDVKRHPTIDGVITAMERVDGTSSFRISGDLVFRGVSRSCRDVVSLEVIDDRTVRLEGRSTFDIRDFGMEPPRILMMRVESEVVVRIDIVTETDG